MRRPILVGLCVLVLASLIVPAVGAETTAPEPNEPCGLTTLDATLQIDEETEIDPETGVLECGPPQPLKVRTELAPAAGARIDTRAELTSFLAIADVQLADEESPARAEGADPCFPSPGIDSSAFRPHETMVPHLMNAHIRAANAIAAAGSPNLGADFDFLVGLGDLADNQQWNEIRWIIDILDGGQLINPNTGNDAVLGGQDSYDGPQAHDPVGANGRTTTDVAPELPGRVLDLANSPFWATGFRMSNDLTAQRLPWYSLPGNHDVKVQGTLPDELTGHHHDDMKAWRAVYRSYYIGHVKGVFQDLPPDYKQELCAAFEEQDPERVGAVLERIADDPENAVRATARKIVPADEGRMPLYRSQEMKQPGDEELCKAVATPARPLATEICESSWIDEHRHTQGIPVGHGYGEEDLTSPRCRDVEGGLLERACYSFDAEPFYYVAMDTNPPEGAEKGNIDPAQFEWIERELIAHSSTYYAEDGTLVENPEATDRLIVLFGHHPSTSMENQAPTSEGKVGDDLVELLLRFPNVILSVNGHTHRNEIWPHGEADDRTDTGYWEVNTSAIADFPTQSRVIEIADNDDGTLSIFGTVFDAAVAPDAAHVDWEDDDPTPEQDEVNEDWLASWGREVMFYDPQQDLTKNEDADDLNVELLLTAPGWFQNRPQGSPSPTGEATTTPTPTDEPTESASPTDEPSESPTGQESATPTPSGDGGGSGSGGSGGTGGSGGGSGSGGNQPSPEATQIVRGSAATTIAADRSRVRFGRAVTLSGVVSGTRTCGINSVAVSARRFGETEFRAAATADVREDGSWQVSIVPRRNAAYIAAPATESCDSASSTQLDVLVRARVAATVLGRCAKTHEVIGRVSPASPGARVALQGRRGTGWKKVSGDQLDRRSRFALEIRRCRGTYRVVGPIDSLTVERGIGALAL